MNFRDLRYFQAVAEQGSYSRAAELLRISQPALSRAVHRLELDLDVALFERHGHGARLTESGCALVERANGLLRQLEQARAEVRGGIEIPSGVLDFAVPPGAATFLVPPIITALKDTYPNVFLRVHEGFSGQLCDRIVRGQVDLACIHNPIPMRGVAMTPLIDEEIFLVGRDLPLTGSSAQIKDLASIPLILPSHAHSLRRLIDVLVAEKRITLNLRAEVDGQQIIKLLLKEGVGASLLTWGAVHEEVERGELTALKFKPSLRRPLTLLERSNATVSKPHITLVETVKRVARELTASGVWPGRVLDGRHKQKGKLTA